MGIAGWSKITITLGDLVTWGDRGKLRGRRMPKLNRAFVFTMVPSLVALMCITAANGAEVLDQSFTAGVPTNSGANIYGPPGPVSTAETFTTGISGVLSRVAVEVAHYPGNGDLSVRILRTTNGVPDTTWDSVLGVATVPASSVPHSQTLVSVPLTGAPIPMAIV